LDNSAAPGDTCASNHNCFAALGSIRRNPAPTCVHGGTYRQLGGICVRSDYWDQPAFETIRPRRLVAPVVFNSPHSGRVYPERFLAMARLDHLSIRQSEDAFVDELF